MIDFDALALGPNFQAFGKDVTYTPVAGSPVTIRVIPTFVGQRIDSVGELSPWSEKPMINVRVGDVAAEPVGGEIVMDSVTYKITNHLKAPGPNAGSTGETTLVLEDQSA